jgi:DNA-binding NarL/FixJ family response regulator
MTRRRIIIVDDHPLFRAALRQTLAGGDATVSVEEAGDLANLSKSLDADRDCCSISICRACAAFRGCCWCGRNIPKFR